MSYNPGPSSQVTPNIYNLTTGNSTYPDALIAHSKAHAALGFNTFCQQAGVTGVNDGTRDDAPLLLNAYNAAVAAGAKCLILPVGIVYVNARVPDASYPYDYVLRTLQDDFWTIIPPGCMVIDQNTNNPGSRGFNDIFQVGGGNSTTVKRSGLINLGVITSASPGVSGGTTPNNYSTACHITSTSDQCFYANGGIGVVDGLCCTTQGAIDNSSANRAYIYGAIVRNCVKGVVQSSTGSTVKALISDVSVDGYQAVTGQGAYGIGINGADVELAGFIKINNSTYTGTLGSWAIAADNNSIVEKLEAGGASIRLSGPGGGIANQGAIILNGALWSTTGSINFGGISLSGFAEGLAKYGLRKPVKIDTFTTYDTTFAIDRFDDGTHFDLGDLYINNVDISATYQGTRSSNTSNTGKLFLGPGRIQLNNGSGGSLIDANTITVFPDPQLKMINASGTTIPAVPLANRGDIQRIASGTITATSSINNLTTILTGTATTSLTPPASPVDGQIWTLRSEGAIGTFNFASGTFAGAPTSLTAGYSRTFIYDATSISWT